MTPPIRSNDLLAVYGLLRPGGGGLERLGLTSDVVAVSPCRIPGALYDLGGYPGLVDGAGEVSGDLMRVMNDGAGSRLDAFEDFDPLRPNASLYVRRHVELIEPRRRAWVYVFNRGVQDRLRIERGDWLQHLADRDGGA